VAGLKSRPRSLPVWQAAIVTRTAVVLLSGGIDSAVCAAIARADGHDIAALTFDYGQKHYAEVAFAYRVARSLGIGAAQRGDGPPAGGGARPGHAVGLTARVTLALRP
jgi:3'-phosphoadenosine 5'-phosphosulfate sulfotransferase (PAPS reductase)/FAD synthetase